MTNIALDMEVGTSGMNSKYLIHAMILTIPSKISMDMVKHLPNMVSVYGDTISLDIVKYN
jgi:hypothetical protein